MNALTVRLTVVSLVSVLGLLAIAQARYGRKESQAAVHVSSEIPPYSPGVDEPTGAALETPARLERAESLQPAAKSRPNRLRAGEPRYEDAVPEASPDRTDGPFQNPFQDTQVEPAEYEAADSPRYATEGVAEEAIADDQGETGEAIGDTREAIRDSQGPPPDQQPLEASPMPDDRQTDQPSPDGIPDAAAIGVAAAASDANRDRYASGRDAGHDRYATEPALLAGDSDRLPLNDEPATPRPPATPGLIHGTSRPLAAAGTTPVPAATGQRGLSSDPATRPLPLPRSSENASPADQADTPWEQERPTAIGKSRPAGMEKTDDQPRQTDVATEAGTGLPGPREFEGPQAPSLSIEKLAPQEIQVGKECTFLIRVQNTGQLAAHAVTVQDEIPQRTQLILTEPPATRTADGQLVWQLGTLAAGDETTLEVQLMPLAEGEVGSVATVHFETRASVRSLATKPELLLQIDGPQQVMIGEEARFQIKITNPGSGAATGVILLEDVPEGLHHPAGERLEFEVGTLAPGDERDLELVLTADKAGKTANTISARGDGSLAAQAAAAVEVIAPQLTIRIQGPKRRYLERPATYTVSVDNPGTAAAKDVELVAYLPKGMQFVRANNHGHYDPQTHRVVWGLEELPPQEKGSVKLVAIPVEVGEQTLRAEGHASQGLKDEAKQTVAVAGLAEVMFTVADLEDPIEVGGETAYEIHVVNQGSIAATQVQVMVELPEQMRLVNASGPSQHTIDGNRILFAPLRRLAPKADTVYRVDVQGLSAGDHRVRVQLVSEEVNTPVTKEETTRFYEDE